MKLEPSELEGRVMNMLLAGNEPELGVLREQYRVAEVRQRTFTGVGFFVLFSVPPSAPRVAAPHSAFHIGDVQGDIEGQLVAFAVHVADGAVTALEGATFEGPWPEDDDTIRLSYFDGEIRDASRIRGIRADEA